MYVNAASRDEVYDPLKFVGYFFSQSEGLWLDPTSQTSLVVLPTGSRKTSSSAEFHRPISVHEVKHVPRYRSHRVREKRQVSRSPAVRVPPTLIAVFMAWPFSFCSEPDRSGGTLRTRLAILGDKLFIRLDTIGQGEDERCLRHNARGFG